MEPSTDDEPAPAAPPHAFTMPLSHRSNTIAEDADDLEYEYSAIETETFYLTLDLTTPTIVSSRAKTSEHQGRGRFKAIWHNPGLSRHKRQLGKSGKVSLPSTKGKSKVSDSIETTPAPVENPVEDEDDEAAVDDKEEPGDDDDGTADFGTFNNVNASAKELTHDVEILDLHGLTPIIRFRDETFSCHWASNIGTELLFTEHNDRLPLPALRSLPGKVDLLAASSARIVGEPLTLTLKSKGENPKALPGRMKPGPRRRRRASSGSSVEDLSGTGTAYEHQDQRGFLERLSNIKVLRGETDKVTLKVERRLTRTRWDERVHERRKQERAMLNKILNGRGHTMATEDETCAATERLRVMAEEDMILVEAHSARKLKAKPGRKPVENRIEVEIDGRPVKKRRSMNYKNAIASIPTRGTSAAQSMSAFSTFTSATWGESKGTPGGGYEDADEGEEDDEDDEVLDEDTRGDSDLDAEEGDEDQNTIVVD